MSTIGVPNQMPHFKAVKYNFQTICMFTEPAGTKL